MIAGAAGDAMDARGLNGLSQGHRRQEGGEPPGQHRLARPGRAKEEHIMGRTPAYHFASPVPLGMPIDPRMNLLCKLDNRMGPDHDHASSSALASCRSAVSNPSVNQP
jgi:hypothetical protein